MDDGLSERKELGFRAEDVLFCGHDRQYYFMRKGGDYVGTNERDISRRLARLGFNPYKDTKMGQTLSEIEEKLMDIIEDQRVDYAFPVAGHPVGVLTQGNERILITKELPAIEPKEGDWDVLRAFLEGLFNTPDGSCDQIEYVYSWLSRAMAGLLHMQPNSGQAFIIAGDPDCGKTLVSKLLRMLFGGRVGKPYEYLTGQTRFNDELFATSLQMVDDEADKTDIRSRRHFVSGIKRFVGADGSRGEAKGGITFEVQPHWRIVIVCNFEEDNLRVLPPLDNDVIDKLILLRGYRAEKFPMPVGTVEEQKEFLETLISQLPAFMHFLMNEWKIPEALRFDRFGVRSYLNMDIVHRMDQITPWFELMLSMENEVLRGDYIWVGTATDLYGLLRNHSSLTVREKERYTVKGIGKHLTKVSGKFPDRCWQDNSTGRHRLWVFISERAERPIEEKGNVLAKISQYLVH